MKTNFKYQIKEKKNFVIAQEIETEKLHRIIKEFKCSKEGYKVLKFLKTRNHDARKNDYYISVEKLLEILNLPNGTQKENQDLIESIFLGINAKFSVIKSFGYFLYNSVNFEIDNIISTIDLNKTTDVVKITFFVNPFTNNRLLPTNEERQYIF